VHFAMSDIQAVQGSRSVDLPLLSIGAWIFYAKELPQYIGWPALLLAIVGGPLALLGRAGLPKWFNSLIFIWFALDYFFFSIIAVREPRYGLMMGLPLAFYAVIGLRSMLSPSRAQGATLLLGIGTL